MIVMKKDGSQDKDVLEMSRVWWFFDEGRSFVRRQNRRLVVGLLGKGMKTIKKMVKVVKQDLIDSMEMYERLYGKPTPAGRNLARCSSPMKIDRRYYDLKEYNNMALRTKQSLSNHLFLITVILSLVLSTTVGYSADEGHDLGHSMELNYFMTSSPSGDGVALVEHCLVSSASQKPWEEHQQNDVQIDEVPQAPMNFDEHLSRQ